MGKNTTIIVTDEPGKPRRSKKYPKKSRRYEDPMAMSMPHMPFMGGMGGMGGPPPGPAKLHSNQPKTSRYDGMEVLYTQLFYLLNHDIVCEHRSLRTTR